MLPRDSTTVLLVTPPATLAQLDTDFLRAPGIRLITCPPDERTLGLARRERPRLIIEDIRAAEAAALELCAELKSDPRTRRIPLLLVAAGESIEAARQAGADALLCEPLARRELFEAVRRWVPLPERRFERYPVNLRFTFDHAGRTIQVFSRDISPVGAFIKTDRSFPPGTRLALTFFLPGNDLGIGCDGVVRQTSEGPRVTNRGLGIEFEGLSDADLERLESFLSRFAPRRFRFS